MKKIFRDAINHITVLPTNENETFVFLSAATLLSAGVKMKYLEKHTGYAYLKKAVSRLADYCIENPDAHLIDELYYNASTNCIYFRCLGVQFSYHYIYETSIIMDYANSDKNKEVTYDAIYKQPKSAGIYKLAKECLKNKIVDRDYINTEIEKLDYDYPSLLVRHLGEKNDRENNEINLTTILSTRYIVTNFKK